MRIATGRCAAALTIALLAGPAAAQEKGKDPRPADPAAEQLRGILERVLIPALEMQGDKKGAAELRKQMKMFERGNIDGLMQGLMRRQMELMRQLQGMPGMGGGGGGALPGRLPQVRPFGGLGGLGGLPRPAAARPSGSPRKARLGVSLGVPSAALRDQLDLPAGQGLVVTTVVPDSPAAKAGLKVNDILLEVDGETVPDETAKFVKKLAAVPADKEVEIVLLRKARKETIEGVKLPAAREFREPGAAAPPIPQRPAAPPAAMRVPVPAGGGVQVQSSTVNGRLRAQYQDGTGRVVITGKREGGKLEPESIEVTLDGKTEKAESVGGLPEKFRELAGRALRAVGG